MKRASPEAILAYVCLHHAIDDVLKHADILRQREDELMQILYPKENRCSYRDGTTSQKKRGKREQKKQGKREQNA